MGVKKNKSCRSAQHNEHDDESNSAMGLGIYYEFGDFYFYFFFKFMGYNRYSFAHI
jgi:hypothetical protein